MINFKKCLIQRKFYFQLILILFFSLLVQECNKSLKHSSSENTENLSYPWYKKEAASPEPIPPVYSKLKDLHINTTLVKSVKSNASIIIPVSNLYMDSAKHIQNAIKKQTGVTLPIVTDDRPEAAVPVRSNLIVLGNRSTNKTIEELYNLHYTLLDLRYPGPEGYEVQTLHNPFGNGNNVVFVGGSDSIGMKAAADVFISKLGEAEFKQGSLSVGWLAEIKLGKDMDAPQNVKDYRIWDASQGYGSSGYFGWNIISKHMALYYMTGNEFHAREFLRLAFPDEQARKEITAIEGEGIENKFEPLSGPYHYKAHMMILFWDLIEESPFFTDEQRLRITNAFSKQLDHRMEKFVDYVPINGRVIYNRMSPYPGLDNRHGQWSAVSIYVLGRYFQRDYPNPIWKQCIKGPEMLFASLDKTAWIEGDENDDLMWHNTFIEPIYTYLLLSGKRTPVKNGILREVMSAQETIVSGARDDWALRYASIGYLNKAAYLLQDGRYSYYRELTAFDTSGFLIGQSFWPEEHLKPVPPVDRIGRWNVWNLPKEHWLERKNGFKPEESFYAASYRSAANSSGDFILLDGYKGDGRNPYHCFAINQLRIDGLTLLNGYKNQVWTLSEGLAEPEIPRNTALRYREVIGNTAIVVGEAPNAVYCNWKRTIAQRVGKYALITDELTYRENSDYMEVEIMWETAKEIKKTIPSNGILLLQPSKNAPEAHRRKAWNICLSDPLETTVNGGITMMHLAGKTKKGQQQVFFSVIAQNPNDPSTNPVCVRIAENAAALALPEPAVAVIGSYNDIEGELVILAADHLTGKNLKQAGPGNLFSTSSPIDIDWDFDDGSMSIINKKETEVHLAIESCTGILVDGKPAIFKQEGGDMFAFSVAAGEHIIENIVPPASVKQQISANLESFLKEGRDTRKKTIERAAVKTELKAPSLNKVFSTKADTSVADLAVVHSKKGGLIYAAEGKNIHILNADGSGIQILRTDSTIRKLRWWAEHELLLAGCIDEKVIAFDKSGNRKWTFVSEMHPEVMERGKTYWYKSAYPGIYGLSTGIFLNGESQAFVGSACTVEILDKDGNLLHRLPQFWGPTSIFTIIEGPDGTLNLLAVRTPSGHHRLGVINNKTLDPTIRAFDTVLPGHSNIRSFGTRNRNHIFYEDMDNDGKKEVVSEVNGYWNRVQIWDNTGKALYEASIGPGEPAPAKNIRYLDITDFTDDGHKEIIAATSKGFVIALDNRCRKIWSIHFPEAPSVIKCINKSKDKNPLIVVGCEDGKVFVLDSRGDIIKEGSVNGNPVCIDEIPIGSENGVILSTDKGEIALFNINDN